MLRNENWSRLGLSLCSGFDRQKQDGCRQKEETTQTEGISQLGHQMPFQGFQHMST